MTTPTKEMAEAAIDMLFKCAEEEWMMSRLEVLDNRLAALEAENERLLDALLEIRETAALMCSHRTPPECSITDVVDTILKPTEEALKGGE